MLAREGDVDGLCTEQDVAGSEVLDEIIVDDIHNPKWPIISSDTLPPLSPVASTDDRLSFHRSLSSRFGVVDELALPPSVGMFDNSGDGLSPAHALFAPKVLDESVVHAEFDSGGTICKQEDAIAIVYPDNEYESIVQPPTFAVVGDASSCTTAVALGSDGEGEGLSVESGLDEFIKTPCTPDASGTEPYEQPRKKVQKPPTTAGITLDNLKAVFGLERPEAEKRLGLKRTTFSNLSRYYGISKWPFRTIRDASNRKKANEIALRDKNLSKEKRKKLLRQQMNLQGVINLMYSDPSQSKDSNTLAVLMNIVASREEGNSLY